MSSRNWLIAWLVASLAISVVANLYTRSSIFDLTMGHIVIAGILGLLVISFCFVIVESIIFVSGLLRRSARKD